MNNSHQASEYVTPGRRGGRSGKEGGWGGRGRSSTISTQKATNDVQKSNGKHRCPRSRVYPMVEGESERVRRNGVGCGGGCGKKDKRCRTGIK